jgi:hypothetical protein
MLKQQKHTLLPSPLQLLLRRLLLLLLLLAWLLLLLPLLPTSCPRCLLLPLVIPCHQCGFDCIRLLLVPCSSGSCPLLCPACLHTLLPHHKVFGFCAEGSVGWLHNVPQGPFQSLTCAVRQQQQQQQKQKRHEIITGDRLRLLRAFNSLQ